MNRTSFILVIFGILTVAGYFVFTSEKSIDLIPSPRLTSSPTQLPFLSPSPEPSGVRETVLPLNECKITGCSGQLCSDEDVRTTCEFKEEYACYKTAKCERQEDGKCGWTPTEELVACLSKVFKAEAEQ